MTVDIFEEVWEKSFRCQLPFHISYELCIQKGGSGYTAFLNQKDIRRMMGSGQF